MVINKRTAAPPAAPLGFSPDSYFRDVHWHQRWEIFRGIFVPGQNRVDYLCEAAQLPADLSGKRVLDVGAWNGCFSFECERRGAQEVIALSLENPAQTGFDRMKRLLGSKVHYVNGSVYTISPGELGTFDVILFFGVLYHLRYPLLAMDRLRSVSRGEVFIETHVIDEHPWLRGWPEVPEQVTPQGAALQRTPIWRQYAEFELNPGDQSNWFGPNVVAVLEAFQTAGFEIAQTQSWTNRAAFRAKVSTIPARLLQHSYESVSPRMHAYRTRFSLAQGRLYFVAVWLVYSSLAFLIARWNVTSHQHPKDLRLVFAGLAVAAWAGYWFALVGSPYLRPRSVYRHLGLVFLSLAGVFFSTLLWLLLAVKAYSE
jgi:tRNA (mo5U34)-methyltransferase